MGRETGEFQQVIGYARRVLSGSLDRALALHLMAYIPLSIDNFLPGLQSAGDEPVLSQLPSWQWL